MDADNYLGPIYVSEHGAVDWNADHTKLIEDIARYQERPHV